MKIFVRSKMFRLVGAILLTGIIFALLFFARIYFYEPGQLEITHVTIPVKQWAGTQNRAVLCAVGDVHWSPKDTARAKEIVSAMLAQKPDAFLLLGDYAHGHTRQESMTPAEIAKQFSPLTATGTPCFAVLGNHDAYFGRQTFVHAFESVGIHVFSECGIATIKLHSGAKIAIGGTLDAHSYLEIFDDSCVPRNTAPEARPLVLLSHSPDVVPWINKTVDLTLCGHTHGGQICLPNGTAVFTSTRTKTGRQYSSGLFNLPTGGKIFTTRGTGTSVLPFRLFCLPEIVVIELLPEEICQKQK